MSQLPKNICDLIISFSHPSDDDISCLREFELGYIFATLRLEERDEPLSRYQYYTIILYNTCANCYVAKYYRKALRNLLDLRF